MRPRLNDLSSSQSATESFLLDLRAKLEPVKSRGWGRLAGNLAVTFAAVAIASGVRILLAPVLYDRASFLLFCLAVMVSAWIGGWRMGLMATVLASAAGIWLFIRPFDHADLRDLQDATQALLFGLTGCGISFLAGELEAARQASQREADHATRSRDELAELVESIAEGFQAFGRDYRLIFMNKAAEQMLQHSRTELLGKPVWAQFPAVIGAEVAQLLRRAMDDRRAASCETYYEAGKRWFAINVYPFRDGISVLFRDISERKRGQQEREGLISELKQALTKVRTLHGLIPICASCKKIRDDRGYWEQLEIYIRDHSEAEFSHGLCPECAEEYLLEARRQ